MCSSSTVAAESRVGWESFGACCGFEGTAFAMRVDGGLLPSAVADFLSLPCVLHRELVSSLTRKLPETSKSIAMHRLDRQTVPLVSRHLHAR